MFTAGNIVFFIACLVLILFFRRLDRKRMQLSTVKKYCERIIADYEEVTKAKQREFRDATIELDLLMKKAQFTQKNTDGALGSIQKLLDEINERKQELSDLAAASAATEKSAAEVQRINKSLIKDEEAIRKLVSTIETNRAALTDIEKRIPALEKNFHTRIEDKIASWVKNMESQEFSRMEKLLENARLELTNELKAACHKAGENFTKTISDIDTRLAGYDENLVHTLHKHQDDFSAFIEKNAQAKKDSLAAEYKTQEEHLHKAMKHTMERSLAELNGAANELTAKKDSLAAEYKTQEEHLQKAVKHTMERSLAELNGAAHELTAQSDKLARNAFSSLQNNADDLKKQVGDLKTQVEQSAKQAHELTAQSDKLVRQALAGLQNSTDDLKTQIEQSAKQALEEINSTAHKTTAASEKTTAQALSTLTHSAAGASKHAEQKLQQALTEIMKIKKEFEQSAAQTNQGIQQALAGLQSRADKLNAQSEQNAKQVLERINNAIQSADAVSEKTTAHVLAAIAQSAQGASKQGEQKVQQALAEVTKVKKEVDDSSAKLIRLAREKNAEIENILAAHEERIGKILGTVKGEFSDKLDKGRSEVQSLTDKTKAIETSILQFAQKSKVFERAEELTSRLEDELAAYDERIGEIRKEYDRLAGLKQDIAGVLKGEESIRAMVASVDKSRDELSRVEERVKRATLTVEQFEGLIEKKKLALESKMEKDSETTRNELAKFEKTVTEAREKALRQTKDNLGALQADIKEIEKRIKSFTKEASVFDRAEHLQDRLEKNIQTLNAQIENCAHEKKAVAELEKRFAAIQGERDAAEDLLEKIGERRKELQAIESRAAAVTGEIGRIEESLSKHKPLFESSENLIKTMRNEMGILAGGIQQSEELRSRLDELDEREIEVRHLLEGISGDKKSLVTLENRIAAMSDSVVRLEQDLAAQQQNTEMQSSAIEERFREFHEQNSAIDRAVEIAAKLEDELTAYDQRIGETREELAAQLEDEFAAYDGRIGEIRAEYGRLAGLKHDIEGVLKGEESIRALIAGIDKSRDELARVEERVQRANLTVEQFEALIEKKRLALESKLEKDSEETRNGIAKFEKTVTQAREKAQKDSEQTRNEIARLEKTVTEAREKALRQTKDSLGALQTDIKEIDKRIKSFTKEAAVFDRADRLQERLEKNIQTLNAQIENCAHEKKAVAELEKRFAAIQGERDAAEELLGKIGERRKELQAIESRATAVTGEMDRIEESLSRHRPLFEDSRNLIQNMQNEMGILAGGIQQSEELHARLNELDEREDEVRSLLESINGDKKSLVALENRISTMGDSVVKLEQDLAAQRQNAEQQSSAIEERFRGFHEQNGILDRVEELSSQLENDLTAYDERIGETRKELAAQLENDLTAYDKRIVETRKELSARLENDLTAYDERIGETRKELAAQLENDLTAYDERIGEVRAEHDRLADLRQDITDVLQGETSLRAMIDSIDKRRDELAGVEERVKRANLTVEQFEALIEKKRLSLESKLEKDNNQTRNEIVKFEKTVAQAREKAQKDNEQTRNEIAKLEKTVTQAREKALQQTKDSLSSLQTDIKEIEKRIKSFTKEAAIFDRAERMQERLEKNIQTLHAQIENCAHEKKAVAELEKRIAAAQNERGAVEELLGKIGERRKELQAIESRAAAVTGEMDHIEESLNQHRPLFENSRNLIEAMRNEMGILASGMQQSEELHSKLDELDEREDEVRRLLESINGDKKSLVTLENRTATMGDSVVKLEQELSAQQQNAEKQSIEIEERFRGFHEQNGVLDRAEELASQLENEITAYDERIGETRKELAAQLENEFTAYDERIGEIRAEYDRLAGLKQDIANALQGEESLRAMIDSIDKRRDELAGVEERVQRANLTVEQFEALIEKKKLVVENKIEKESEQTRSELAKFEKTVAQAREKAQKDSEQTRNELAKFEKTVAQAREKAQKDSEQTRNEIAKLEKTVTQAREKALQQTKDSLSSLQTDIKEIEKRIKSFTKEAAIFDRAERMQERLEKNIQALHAQIENCAHEKKAVAELEKRFTAVQNERDAAEDLLEKIGERKKELQAIENRAAAVTGEIGRIEASLSKHKPLFENSQNLIKTMQNEMGILASGMQQSEDLRSRLDELDEREDEVRRLLEGINGDKKSLVTLENRIATMGDSVIKLEQDLVAQRQNAEKQSSAIEERFRGFHEQNGVLDRAEELSAQLENELAAYDQRIGEIRKERDHLVEIKQDITGVLKGEESIRAMIVSVNKSRGELSNVEERVQHANLAVEQFEALIEKKKLALENKIEKDSEGTRNELAKLEQKFTTLREKTMQDAKDNLGSLRTDIKEIDKRIKGFTKETALFDRADKLSSKLSEDIAELNSHITQLRVDKKELHDLGKQIEEIRTEEGEVARIANAISDDKKHLVEVEKRTKDLIQASQSVEERIRKISEAGTTVIAPVEAKLQALSDIQQQVQKGITDLTAKDEKLSQSHTRFKKAESFANRLEERLSLLKTDYEQAEKERTALMKHVEQVQEKSRKLIENEGQINKIASNFDQMEGMLADVEKRTTQLTIAQDKLTRMEDSIRDLLLQADVRIEDFSALNKKLDSLFSSEGAAGEAPRKTQSQTVSSGAGRAAKTKTAVETPPPVKTEKDRKLNDMIFKFHDQGMDANQIARIVNRPVSDIELRLHMRKD